jgi:amidase
VAVSANFSSLAVGTETDGSIVCPSSMCGLVGVKPTLGLISRSGIIPLALSQDTAGPVARTVRDAALLLGAMTGVDPQDSVTGASRNKSHTDYTQALTPKGLRGARIGVARQFFNMGPAVTALMESCIDLIRAAGADIVDPADIPSFEKWRETEALVMAYEFKAGLNRYLAGRGGSVRSLEDVIAFNAAHPAEEMPYFGQELLKDAQTKGPLSDPEYKAALRENGKLTRKQGIDAVIHKYGLDALIGPTAGPAWMTDWVSGDHTDSGCASPPAIAGYPHITVPAGLMFGLPIGISFFGSAWSEPTLLKFAYAFEQARHARQKPRFLSTVDYFAR